MFFALKLMAVKMGIRINRETMKRRRNRLRRAARWTIESLETRSMMDAGGLIFDGVEPTGSEDDLLVATMASPESEVQCGLGYASDGMAVDGAVSNHSTWGRQRQPKPGDDEQPRDDQTMTDDEIQKLLRSRLGADFPEVDSIGVVGPCHLGITTVRS
jgi:hypothetical protein